MKVFKQIAQIAIPKWLAVALGILIMLWILFDMGLFRPWNLELVEWELHAHSYPPLAAS
jgi:hypothetical protein